MPIMHRFSKWAFLNSLLFCSHYAGIAHMNTYLLTILMIRTTMACTICVDKNNLLNLTSYKYDIESGGWSIVKRLVVRLRLQSILHLTCVGAASAYPETSMVSVWEHRSSISRYIPTNSCAYIHVNILSTNSARLVPSERIGPLEKSLRIAHPLLMFVAYNWLHVWHLCLMQHRSHIQYKERDGL